MKKSTKKVTGRSRTLSLALAFLMLLATISFLSITAYAETSIPDPTSQFYVNDFADVFTAAEESQLMNNAVTLAEEHDGIQVVVTTIESLGGDTIENYAVTMYNNYGIGKDDMGLLILLSTGDRQIRVEVGKAMEAYINDSKAGRFIDEYAIPSLKENKFNIGLINLQEAFVEEIISCVEKENPIVEASTETSKSSIGSPALIIFVFVLVIGITAIITIVVYKLTVQKKYQFEIDSLKNDLASAENRNNSLKNSHNSEIDSLKGQINSLNQTISHLRTEKQTLQQSRDAIEDRYNRAQTLHPSIDDEVTAMIKEEIRQKDMEAARFVDTSINGVIHLNASKDLVNEFNYVLSQYSDLNENQQSYVTGDISKVKALYSASVKLKEEYEEQLELERRQKCAAVALASITAIIACMSVGRARDLYKLKEAKSIYDGLDSGSRAFFDTAVLNKLDRLLVEAKRDKRREEEEERRRRRQREEEEERRRNSYSHNSHSSFSGGSSFGGFGGRSGGGGASRGF